MNEPNKKQTKLQLPEYSKYKNFNFITLLPEKHDKLEKHEKQGKSSIEFDNESRVKNYLEFLSFSYNNEFVVLCDDEIEDEYADIFNKIKKFTMEIKNYEDTFYQCLLINSDQNSNIFYKCLDKKMKIEKTTVEIIGDTQFKDLSSLLKKLSLFTPLYLTKDESINCKDYPLRLVIIRDIPKIEKSIFNDFISKLIDYNTKLINKELPKQDKGEIKHYRNILIFDVAHDLNSLFNKLLPNYLLKMAFNNIIYTPSRYIYKSIIYKFIKDRGNLFFPNEASLSKLLYYIDNYQISLTSFKYYFKYLIMDFFIYRNWCDEYIFLIYDDQLIKLTNETNTNKDKKQLTKDEIYKQIKSILIERGKEIGLNKEDSNFNAKIENLIISYNSLKINRNDFLFWSETLSKMIEKALFGIKSGDINLKNIKIDFFFRFLALGQKKKIATEHRINIFIEEIAKYYKKDEKEDKDDSSQIIDCYDFINKIFKVIFQEEVNKAFKNNSELIYQNKLATLIKNFKDNTDFDANFNNEGKRNKKIISNIESLKKNNYDDNDDIPILSNSTINTLFKNWLIELFKDIKAMSWLDHYLNIPSHPTYKFGLKYFNLYENIVNPCFERILMNDFKLLSVKNMHEKKEDDIEDYDSNVNTVKKQALKSNKKNPKMKFDNLEIEIVDSENGEVNYTQKKDFNIEETTRDQIYFAFLDAFASLGFEFRLKPFFVEFLKNLKFDLKSASFVNKNKVIIKQMSSIFLKFSHEFCILGYFHRKKGKNSDIFIKNYYENKGFFDNKLDNSTTN